MSPFSYLLFVYTVISCRFYHGVWDLRIQILSLKTYHFTLPETNIAPENQYQINGRKMISFWEGLFSLVRTVHFRECKYIYICISSGFSKPHPRMHFFHQRKIHIIWFALALKRWKCSTCFVKGDFFFTTQPQPDIGNKMFHSPTGKGQNRYMPCNPCIGLYRRPVCDSPFGGWFAMVQRTMGPSPNPVSPRVDGVDQGANLARIRQQAGNLAARALTQKLLNVGGVGGLEGGMWRAMESLGETPQIPRAAYNQGIGRDVPRSQRGAPYGKSLKNARL